MMVLGKENGGLHHNQGRHTRDLRIGLQKYSGIYFEYSSNIQLRIILFSLYLCLAQRLICVCNSSKCWFKDLLPERV